MYTKSYVLDVANERIKLELVDKNKLLFLNEMPKVEIIKDDEYYEKIKIGNIYHIVLFVENIDKIDLVKVGKLLSNDSVNVNFAKVIDRHTIQLVTYEKGVGLTLACSSGAFCTYHMAKHYDYIDEATTINMNGGSVLISESQILGTAKIISSGVFYL